ncbi:MAG: hypothetical protein VKJ02_08965 [Snowella sp.]|nr:hypothetical protein [Snowella sp.]
MNPRFQFQLIRYLNRYPHRSHQGFVLPMAMMIGLVVIVVGMTVIIRAQGDQSKGVSQAMTAKADAIAEAGVTQYVNFLNNNRGLLTFPDCDGTRDSSGACPDTGTTIKSWSLVSNIYPSPAGATCNSPVASSGVPSTATMATMANTSDSNGWKTIGDGKYKLVGYKYTPDGAANTAPGTAILALQGQAGDSNSASAAKSQVAVQFRVTANTTGTPLIPQTNPGLWARSFSTAADVHANVLDSSGCTGSTQFNATIGNLPSLPIGALPNGNNTPPLSSTAGTLTRQNIPFPPLPTYPSDSQFTTLIAGNKVNSLANCSRTQYPQTGDYDSDGNAYSSSTTTPKIYKYRITGACAPPNNVQFGTTGKGNETIIMYIDSTLDIANNAKISTNGSSNAKVQWLLKTADLDLGGNAQVGSSAPDASTAESWAFFLYSGTSVSMRGTPDYYAFIFAPYANADMRGNPKIAGALWVNSFQTNGAPPKIFQATTQADLNEIFTAAYTASGDTALIPANAMASISSFQKQGVGTSVVAVAAPSVSPSASPTTSPTPSPSASPTTSPSPSPSPVCSVTAPSSVVFTRNGGSGTVSVSYANANNLTISATVSGGTISPASRTGLSGSGATTFTVSYSNGSGSGSVTFSSSCGSRTTSFTK